MFGPVAQVYGEVAALRGVADDSVFLALTHTSGMRSHLSAGAVVGAPGPRLRVLGEEAAYVVEGLDGQEDALRAGHRPPSASWGQEPEERWGRLVKGDEAEVVRSERGRWDLFYAEVERCLREGAPPPVDASDAVHVLDVLEAGRRSAATGQTVSLDPPPTPPPPPPAPTP
jgi:predicted dehydrogenase